MKDINFLTSKGVDVKTSLDLFGDIETYNNNLGGFIVSAPANFTIYVHSLMSDSKYFGFNDLANLAVEQEAKSRAGDVLYIQQNFPALQNSVNNAVAIANEYLNDIPAPGSSNETSSEQEGGIKPELGEIYDTQTILVVDDSNIIRNFVKRIFSDRYNIGTAKDGQEAINIIFSNKENDNIAAILLDLNMPGVDGFAVLEYMQQNGVFNKIPVSIISGDSSRDTIDRAFKYTIVDMLGKPFTESDIKRILEKTILYKDML